MTATTTTVVEQFPIADAPAKARTRKQQAAIDRRRKATAKAKATRYATYATVSSDVPTIRRQTARQEAASHYRHYRWMATQEALFGREAIVLARSRALVALREAVK